jgi:hypothetical protein
VKRENALPPRSRKTDVGSVRDVNDQDHGSYRVQHRFVKSRSEAAISFTRGLRTSA